MWTVESHQLAQRAGKRGIIYGDAAFPGDLKVEHVSCTLPEPAGPITRTPNLLILALLRWMDNNCEA